MHTSYLLLSTRVRKTTSVIHVTPKHITIFIQYYHIKLRYIVLYNYTVSLIIIERRKRFKSTVT